MGLLTAEVSRLVPSTQDISFKYIERPRLIRALDRVLEQPVALVIAPAGYGKSVLVADWLAHHSGVDSAWVSMDARDNDIARYWTRIVRALDSTLPGIVERTDSAVRRATPDAVAAVAESLVEALAARDGDLVVVLDDVHLVTDKGVIDSWVRFMDDLPISVHVILIARHDLPLPARRLRAAGRLCEIREADLRFTVPETEQLLEAAGVMVSGEAAASLNSRTEGWGAALRLAALSLVDADDPEAAVGSFGEVEREIADYLVEELLTDMRSSDREFLLATSIVDELDAPLATVLSGRDDSLRVLEDLVASGSFTSPVPGRPGWYRYHHLFRELLRARLPLETPENRLGLLRKAADYYHQQGALANAVRYATDAHETGLATRWLAEAYADLMNAGRFSTLLDLADRIIREADDPDVRVLFMRMWALYMVHDRDDRLGSAEIELLERVEAMNPGTPDAPESTSPVLDLMTGPGSKHWYRAARARRLGDVQRVLEYDSPEFIPSPSGRLEYHVAEALTHAERYAEAEALLASIEPALERAGYAPGLMAVISLHAMVDVGMGSFGQADALIDRGMRLASSHQLGLAIMTMFARLARVWLCWERGALEEGESAAVEVQEFAEYSSDVPIVATHAELRSRLRWSLGDSAGARNSLDRATILASGRRVRGDFSERLTLARVRLDLLEDDCMAAELWMPDWRERLKRGASTLREHLTLLRFQMATEADLAPVYARLPHEDRASPLHLFELARLRALAMLSEGRTDEATDTLAEALSRAVPLGATQGFIDDRRGLAPIVERAVRKAGVSLPGLASEVAEGAAAFVEPLTERESELLGLMSTHMTYPEIGDELFVSINTVRTHVKSIYRKLAVSSRSDAVERARAYGILS